MEEDWWLVVPLGSGGTFLKITAMKRYWNKPYKKVEKSRNCDVMVDNQWLGPLEANTEGIIIEDTSRDGQRKVKQMRTTNIDLLAGQNTIAVFKIKDQKQIMTT